MEAELIVNVCRGLHQLPERGAVLDQPVWLMRHFAIVGMVEGTEVVSTAPPPSPLDAIKAELL